MDFVFASVLGDFRSICSLTVLYTTSLLVTAQKSINYPDLYMHSGTAVFGHSSSGLCFNYLVVGITDYLRIYLVTQFSYLE